MTRKLSDGYKRSVYWNKYQTTPAKLIDKGTNIYELLSASFQVAKKSFDFAYDGTNDDEPSINTIKNIFFQNHSLKIIIY